MTSGADPATGGRPGEVGHAGGPAWPPWGAGPGWHQRRPHRVRHGTLIGAAVVGAIEVVGVHVAASHQPGAARLDWLGYALLAAGALALVTRHGARVPSLLVTLAATVAYVSLGYPYGPVFLAPIVAVFGAVRAGRRVALWSALAAAYAVFLAAGRIWPHAGRYALRQPALGFAIEIAVWGALLLVIAEVIRARTAHFAEIRRTMIEQARARQEQERRQASEERLRIAQELHDVLGHHLSLISVQASIGLHLMDEHPEQARTALAAIKEASAEALGEVRAVLAALRPKDEKAPRSPAPSLGDLSALIDADRVVVTGTPRPLPPEVERAAYRIVQESLTNVRRHAGEDAVATVTLAYAADRLTVRIADDGVGGTSGGTAPGGTASAGAAGGGADPAGAAGGGADPGDAAGGTVPGGAGGGSGIAGMRTRAQALGGTLSVASPADGGFVVTAVLPVPQDAGGRQGPGRAGGRQGPGRPEAPVKEDG